MLSPDERSVGIGPCPVTPNEVRPATRQQKEGMKRFLLCLGPRLPTPSAGGVCVPEESCRALKNVRVWLAGMPFLRSDLPRPLLVLNNTFGAATDGGGALRASCVHTERACQGQT